MRKCRVPGHIREIKNGEINLHKEKCETGLNFIKCENSG